MNTTIHTEEELFEAARQLKGPARRAAFLKVSCAGDNALRERISQLLAAEDDAERFFTETAALVNATDAFSRTENAASWEEPVGTRIGRYKLVEKIGAGGCGVVYLAEQEEPVRRRVALKIIRADLVSKSVVARFEAERQALAMMDHPNIARVFDAGSTGSGAPYFVMEHVRGMRITDFCEQGRLSIRERLNLFIQVCHAVQHAHQNCIVHGDIKPSNILIAKHDGVAVPKVIDFGVARATESPLAKSKPFDDCDQAIGTPAYMSPEQMEPGGLEMDTRSDVYSLGVLLFELLTGRVPFNGDELLHAGPGQMAQKLRETPLNPPSVTVASLDQDEADALAANRRSRPAHLASFLEGDLDSITSKALEKDRRHRYETANALAMDVRRYLCHEPVTACASGWLYSFRKLVRRNRGVFVASGAVAVAMVVGMGCSTWLFLKERDARQRAVVAEQQQTRLRHEAEEREKITQAALMVSQDRFEEADAILDGISPLEPTMEGAAVYRSVGEWHAVHSRWKQAAERFGVLLTINHLEGADVSSLDYLERGPVLIELGDTHGYEEFRKEAIARFVDTPTPFADRIVKISLLAPASEHLIASMAPLAELTVKACQEAEDVGDAFQISWRSMSMALYEYRRGNYEASTGWADQSLAYDGANAPLIATARVIRAMALFRLGNIQEADQEWARAHRLVEEKFQGYMGRGTPVYGFWFDWAFARILLREATATIQGPPALLQGSAHASVLE